MEKETTAKTAHGTVRMALRGVLDVALETLWPTRCAVCDLPGEDVLCPDCAQALIPVDACLACPRCGAPYGIVQCTECNEVMLNAAGMDDFPIDAMAHALVLDDAARRIVSAYKDGDERRLRTVIASRMADYVSPLERARGFVVAFVPDTAEALRRRGFDHSREIAEELARLAGLECVDVFERPKSTDQRELGRRQRIDNMRNAMRVKEGANVPRNVLVVDDVCTTGATIYAACTALREAGAECIHALTFAQVMD